MRHLFFIVAVLSLVLGLPACNSDDGGGGPDGNGDGLHGVLFTDANAEHLAGTVAAALNLFPGINGAYILLTGAVDSYGFFEGEPMPADGYDLGDLGICSTGQAVAKWKDLDDSKTLTAGDTVSLEVTDCDDEISGTLDLSFTEVAYALTRADISYDLVTEETVGGTPETGTMTAAYQLEVNRVDIPTEGIIITHRVPDQTDGGSGLLATLNGETTYEMGCFNLYYSINLATGGYVLSEPYAVFKLPDYGVMTMESWGLLAFEFPNGDTPVKGQTKLLAQSGSTPCSRLDIPGDGVDSNDSFLNLTVVNGSSVTLSGATEGGSPFFFNTTWSDLD